MPPERLRAPNLQRKTLLAAGVIAALAVAAVVLWAVFFRRPPHGTTDPPAKLRLEKIFQFYQAYTRQRHRPPPDEEAFKDYLRDLPADEKAVARLGDDVDDFLSSPRDGEKYLIRYGPIVDVGGLTRAIAWEQTGVNGKRFVALSVGYVQECDEETFRGYQK